MGDVSQQQQMQQQGQPGGGGGAGGPPQGQQQPQGGQQQQPQDQQGMNQQQQMQNDQAAFQSFAGYPQLMQQYFQQQQLQQQMMQAGGFNSFAPNMMGFTASTTMNPIASMPMGPTGSSSAGAGGAAGFGANPMFQAGAWGAAGGVDGNADPYAESGILGPWSATSAGLLGKMATTTTVDTKGKRFRKKPKDRPKRPLSAYNIFFKEERARILEKIPDEKEKAEGEENKDDPAAVKKEEEEEGEDEDGKAKKRKKRPHGKIGFENLAKIIGQRWQELAADQVEYYKKKAEVDMKRYKAEMEVYLGKKEHDGDGRLEMSSEPAPKKAKKDDIQAADV